MARSPLLLAAALVTAVAVLACNVTDEGEGPQELASISPADGATTVLTATPPPPTEEPAAQVDPSVQATDASDLQLVAQGETLYQQYCASCHGVELEGQPNWRRRDENGFLPAPPHDASGHTWHHPDQLLFDVTKYGTAAVVGRGYKSNMTAFEEQLSDAEIWAVLSFIKSRWPPRIQNAQPSD